MLELKLLNDKEFFDFYYRKKPILQDEFDEFLSALKEYKTNLLKNLHENEDALSANALAPLFQNLGFKTQIKSKQKGKSEIDLALLSKDSQTRGGGYENLEILIEAKKPDSKEFFNFTGLQSDTREIQSSFNPHCKALYEAILYYFRERERSNSSLKFIIITNFYRFFIFKASEFKELFYENKFFKMIYKNFTNPNLLYKGNTSEFYAECEKTLKNPNYENSIPKKDLFDTLSLKGFYFELKTLFAKDFNEKDFTILKPIFKAFSPEFLLDTFNPNDANTLNKGFYNELLYILGLGEFKQNGKIIIAQSEESKKGDGTLYTAILQSLKDKEIFRAKSEGEKFESLMQLIILWLNRILFLKLIEASLVKFNDDSTLKFLNTHKVPNFHILSGLFFEILAKAHTQRDATHLEALFYLPYLNSSLFEKQEIEKNLLDIAELNDMNLEYFKATQIKDKNAKKKQGKVRLLSYLFEFLDSFDFGSDEEASKFIEQKNDLINSAVLGLVFEKLNGYKEGSFYTHSFITSYMCRQSLQKVIIDKFNAAKSWDCKDTNELKIKLDKLTDSSEGYKEANTIFHSIKICDPAVGSGHFLVSALNELIFFEI